MTSSTKWEVTNFEILANGQDRKSDQLYANGRMQVPLRINIQAVIPGKDQELVPYTLSAEELDRIGLQDEFNGGDLPRGWKYTDHQIGDWSSSLSDRSPHADIASCAESPMTDGGQHHILWISTTANGDQRIQATIPTGEGKCTTNDSVTLRALYPVKYKTEHNIDCHRKEVAKGSWSGTGHPDVQRGDWTQYNWYCSTITHPTKHAEIHDYSPENLTERKMGDRKLTNAWLLHTEKKYFQVAYIWEYGPKREVPFGMSYMDRPESMTVAQEENALCVTLLNCRHPVQNNYLYNFTYPAWFEIFDIYGNSGCFRLKLNADELVEVQNHSK